MLSRTIGEVVAYLDGVRHPADRSIARRISPADLYIRYAFTHPSHFVCLLTHHRTDGQEVGISNLLENVYQDNNRELQYDFGPRVHEGPIRRRNTARQSFIARDNSHRRIEATLVAHLHSHTDCITGFAVAPDHAFFVSASDDGSVKIWDTARLERSVTSKARHTYTQHHARVKSVCIIEGVYCFASAAEDGSVHVVRVHVNPSGSLPKYGKLSVVREHRVESPGEYVTCMSHFNTGASVCGLVRWGVLNE